MRAGWRWWMQDRVDALQARVAIRILDRLYGRCGAPDELGKGWAACPSCVAGAMCALLEELVADCGGEAQ